MHDILDHVIRQVVPLLRNDKKSKCYTGSRKDLRGMGRDGYMQKNIKNNDYFDNRRFPSPLNPS